MQQYQIYYQLISPTNEGLELAFNPLTHSEYLEFEKMHHDYMHRFIINTEYLKAPDTIDRHNQRILEQISNVYQQCLISNQTTPTVLFSSNPLEKNLTDAPQQQPASRNTAVVKPNL